MQFLFPAAVIVLVPVHWLLAVFSYHVSLLLLIFYCFPSSSFLLFSLLLLIFYCLPSSSSSFLLFSLLHLFLHLLIFIVFPPAPPSHFYCFPSSSSSSFLLFSLLLLIFIVFPSPPPPPPHFCCFPSSSSFLLFSLEKAKRPKSDQNTWVWPYRPDFSLSGLFEGKQ